MFRGGFSLVRRGFFHGLHRHCPDLATASLHFYTLLHLGLSAGSVTRVAGLAVQKMRTTHCHLHGGLSVPSKAKLISFLVSLGWDNCGSFGRGGLVVEGGWRRGMMGQCPFLPWACCHNDIFFYLACHGCFLYQRGCWLLGLICRGTGFVSSVRSFILVTASDFNAEGGSDWEGYY